MTEIDWHARLMKAERAEDVIQLAIDFLASWTPEELAKLPEACRPGQVRTAADVSECAYALAQCRLTGEEHTDELLRMVSFFTTAAQRLAQLLAFLPKPR
jgi:hypothetical protein